MGQKSSSVPDDANVLKEGFMGKWDGHGDIYDATKHKKTWCILYDNGIMVYKAKPNHSKEMGHSNFATIKDTFAYGLIKDTFAYFEVRTNKERLRFRCQHVIDRNDWISLIRSVSKITDPQKVTPIELLFRFFVSNDKPLIIEGIEDLPLGNQLDILSFNNIYTAKARAAFVRKLSEDKQERFQKILQLLEGEQRRICVISPIQWSEQQISLSLFCYLMNRLRRDPVLARDMKSAKIFWLFIHYLMRFCEQKKWDGKSLNDYFNEITDNGQYDYKFPEKLIELVCNEYKLNQRKYIQDRRFGRLLRTWYVDHLHVRIRKWQHVITALEHENEALSRIVAATVAKEATFGAYGDEGSSKKLIDALKRKNVTFPEIQYMVALLSRVLDGKSVNADTSS